MPSKPASLASRKHSRNDIRPGYGKAQRLIDFFIRNRRGDPRRGSGSAAVAPSGVVASTVAPPAAATEVESADRRDIEAWPGSRGALTIVSVPCHEAVPLPPPHGEEGIGRPDRARE